MQTDVSLVADIFENFRNQCLTAYGLKRTHYYTTPGMTWNTMLKYMIVKLEDPHWYSLSHTREGEVS